MSSSASTPAAKHPTTMVGMNASANAKQAATKMHRRSRTGQCALPCPALPCLSLPLQGSRAWAFFSANSYAQDALHAVCEGRSATRGSLRAAPANILDWSASTSVQCGGATMSSGDSRRRSLRTSSSARSSTRRRRRAFQWAQTPLRAYAILCRPRIPSPTVWPALAQHRWIRSSH